jgi:hypothetical protein
MSVTGWVRLAVLATAFMVPAATLQADDDDCRRGNRRGGKHYKNSRSYRGGGGYYGGGSYYAPPVRGGYRYAPPPRRVVVVERPVPVYVDRYRGRRGGGYDYGYRQPAYYPAPRVSVGVGVVIR